MDTVRSLLRDTALPRLEIQMLLQHVLGVSRAWLIAHDTDPLPGQALQRFHDLRIQRLAGHPMAHLVGQREFMGHAFAVTPDVLIPRPETELLVQAGLQAAQAGGQAHPRVLDLGTGSGAVAISLALACPQACVTATDASEAALQVARRNAQALGAVVRFAQGDWYAALPDAQPYDVIVSNPPYIAAADAHLALGDLRFEPRQALTDGADGLGALAAIVRDAPRWLAPGGQLWLEHGYDQAQAVDAMLRQAGFGPVRSLPDLAGIPRATGGPIMNRITS